MPETNDITGLLAEMRTELALQREMIEAIHKSIVSTKKMTSARMVFTGVIFVFVCGAVYFYYSTMVSMFN